MAHENIITPISKPKWCSQKKRNPMKMANENSIAPISKPSFHILGIHIGKHIEQENHSLQERIHILYYQFHTASNKFLSPTPLPLNKKKGT